MPITVEKFSSLSSTDFVLPFFLIISITSPISPSSHNNLCFPTSGLISSHLFLYFSCNARYISNMLFTLKSSINFSLTFHLIERFLYCSCFAYTLAYIIRKNAQKTNRIFLQLIFCALSVIKF